MERTLRGGAHCGLRYDDLFLEASEAQNGSSNPRRSAGQGAAGRAAGEKATDGPRRSNKAVSPPKKELKGAAAELKELEELADFFGEGIRIGRQELQKLEAQIALEKELGISDD